MTKDELVAAITKAVKEYINYPEVFDHDPQLRIVQARNEVIPITGRDALAGRAFNQETIECAASVEGDSYESAMDFQAELDPQFAPIKSLVTTDAAGHMRVNQAAVEKLAAELAQ